MITNSNRPHLSFTRLSYRFGYKNTKTLSTAVTQDVTVFEMIKEVPNDIKSIPATQNFDYLI